MPDTDPEDLSMASVEGEVVQGSPPPILEMAEQPDEKYFTSYEDVEIHRLMISDEPRTRAYADAIEKNKHLFKGKTVMDVGAGTGILSLFMAAAGARRVYAVEASGMASVIEQVAQDNGFGDIIKVLHAKVEDVTLPGEEKVDVIVSEWMGFYLLHESMLNSVISARDRFLSEDGTIFPSEARIYACPCTLQALYKEQIHFWDKVYNFNMTALKRIALKTKMVKPEVCLVPRSDLLGEPTCVKTFNLRWVTTDDVQSFSETTFVGITRAGSYQGLCLWFECDFDGRDYDDQGKEFGSLVKLSTSPFSPPTHWKQTVVVLGYSAMQQIDFACQENDQDNECSGAKGSNLIDSDQGATGSSQDKISSSDQEKSDREERPLGREDNNLVINKDYEVDEDEVVGWQLVFSQSKENIRHYTITVEMLDPETEEHPIPCSCPMPRCMIIAKMMEREEAGGEEDDFIDCT